MHVEAGRAAEAFAFLFLARQLGPRFGLASWRSGTRLHRAKDWFEASDHRPLIVSLRLPKTP